MIWKKHPKFKKYEISNCGMVRRVGKQKPLTVKMNNGGKPSVVIRVNKKSVQKPVGQLVLETFKGKNLYKIKRHCEKDKVSPKNMIG